MQFFFKNYIKENKFFKKMYSSHTWIIHIMVHLFLTSNNSWIVPFILMLGMSLETEIACFWNLFPGLVYECFQKTVSKYFSGEQEESLETCCFLICKPQKGGNFFYDVLKLIFFKNNPAKTIFKNVFGKTSPLSSRGSFFPLFLWIWE